MEEIKALVEAVEQLLKHVADSKNDMKFLMKKLIELQDAVIETKQRLSTLEVYSRFKPSYIPSYDPAVNDAIKDMEQEAAAFPPDKE